MDNDSQLPHGWRKKVQIRKRKEARRNPMVFSCGV
jgi:hypothetical protein